MNPINIFQMMKAGPQQFIQQMMGNNQIMSNPMMKNTMQMAQQGNMQGIEQMARNLCKEKPDITTDIQLATMKLLTML